MVYSDSSDYSDQSTDSDQNSCIAKVHHWCITKAEENAKKWIKSETHKYEESKNCAYFKRILNYILIIWLIGFMCYSIYLIANFHYSDTKLYGPYIVYGIGLTLNVMFPIIAYFKFKFDVNKQIDVEKNKKQKKSTLLTNMLVAWLCSAIVTILMVVACGFIWQHGPFSKVAENIYNDVNLVTVEEEIKAQEAEKEKPSIEESILGRMDDLQAGIKIFNDNTMFSNLGGGGDDDGGF